MHITIDKTCPRSCRANLAPRHNSERPVMPQRGFTLIELLVKGSSPEKGK